MRRRCALNSLGSTLGLLPARVGVVGVDFRCGGSGIGAEILFVYLAVVVDDEAHHAGFAVLRRIGNDGKAAQHFAVDDIAVSAAGRVLALLRQYPIVITVVRDALFGAAP